MKKIQDFFKNISVIDWVLLFLLTGTCFFFFMQGDMLHTGGSSFAYLNGHIFDFYEYNLKTLGADNYMPTTYILFAIWNIPMRLFVTQTADFDAPILVRLWYKLFTTIFYILIGFIIYKILREKNIDKKNALLGAFLFYSSPIAIYSQFVFSQYDVITAFFMMLGVYFFVKKKYTSFALSFAVAITCKYYALLIFVPLLLIREKNVWKILLRLLQAGSVFIVEMLLYVRSSAFRAGIFGFGATDFIFNSGSGGGGVTASFVVLLWVFLCAFTYFKKFDDEEDELRYSIFITCMVCFSFFGLSYWHPQWVLFIVPFLVFAIMFTEKPDVYLLLEAVMFVAFTGFLAVAFEGTSDETTFKYGVLRELIAGFEGGEFHLSKFYVFRNKSLWYSTFSAILLVMAFFSSRKYQIPDKNIKVLDHKWLIRLRAVIIVVAFLIPATYAMYRNATGPLPIYQIATDYIIDPLDPMVDESELIQLFRPNGDSITEVKILCYQKVQYTSAVFTVRIVDSETGAELGSTEIETLSYGSNEYVEGFFDNPIPVEPGKEYKLIVTSNFNDPTDRLCIYAAQDDSENILANGYLIFNGVEYTDRDACVIILGHSSK